MHKQSRTEQHVNPGQGTLFTEKVGKVFILKLNLSFSFSTFQGLSILQ